MKLWWYVAFGLIGGLLGAGVLWLMASPPRGAMVRLRPAPTQAPITVHVDGAVQSPGVYTLPLGSRVGDAIQAAGGAREDAAAGAVNLASRLEDGARVWVQPAIAAPDNLTPSGETPALPGLASRININTASAEELEALPGIGPATAAKIVAYREEHGPFSTAGDIQNVSGIGPATFERLEPLITTGVDT